MIVTVNLFNPPQTVVHSGVKRTYTDGEFFCVDEVDGVYKYLRNNVWLVVEKDEPAQTEEEKEAE